MAFTKYKEIRYALDGIPSANLTGFPKRFRIVADADIAAELASGGGIKVTSADGSTDLPIGQYASGTDYAAGDLEFRTLVDPLTGASVGDVICRVYYDGGETTAEDKAAVVANDYTFFGAPGDYSGDVLEDWVSGDTFAGSGGLSTSDLVSGAIGQALDLDGSSDYIDLSNGAATNPTAAATYEVVCEPDSLSGLNGENWAIGRDDESDGRAFALGVRSNGGLQFQANGNATLQGTSGLVTVGVPASLAVSGDSGQGWIGYVDGTAVDSASWLSPNSATGPTTIGRRTYAANEGPFTGPIGETRISSVARSADWIAYAHTDDLDNAGTFTLGPEEEDGGGGDVTVGLTGLGITASAGTLRPNTAVALTGSSGALASGSLVPALAVTLTGLSASATAGTLTPATAIVLTGSGVTAVAGTVAPALSVPLTGLGLVGATGTVSVDGNVTVALTGQSITAATGTLIPSSSVTLSGVQVGALAGSLVPQIAVGLTGATLAAATGSVTPSGGIGPAPGGRRFSASGRNASVFTVTGRVASGFTTTGDDGVTP